MRFLCSCAAALLLAGSSLSRAQGQGPNWQSILKSRLPLYGHRNWIVVADSAYPDQSRDGIETIVANADQIPVLQAVLQTLGNSKHVRPIIYLDKELSALKDEDVPGISSYRAQVQ